MSDDLRNHLHRTADDVHFEVPDLRPRAKAARTRRRLLATGTVAATLVLAAALILPMNLGNTQAVPAETTKPPFTPSPEPTPSPLPSRTNTVPEPPPTPGSGIAHDEIVDRCRSQLAPSIEAFGPIPDDLHVARDRDYQEGDIVRLISPSGWDPSALCIIPPADDPADVDVRGTLEAALTLENADENILLEVCSELDTNEWAMGMPQYAYVTTDLRPGSVLSHIERDGLHHALIDLDDGDSNPEHNNWLECGWEARPDGTFDVYLPTTPATSYRFEVPAMGGDLVYAHWDGDSEHARVVLWGVISPELGTEDISVSGGVDSVAVYSRTQGIYQVITHAAPKGTADDWTATEPFYMAGNEDSFGLTVVARDEGGGEVLSNPVPVFGPYPSKVR